MCPDLENSINSWDIYEEIRDFEYFINSWNCHKNIKHQIMSFPDSIIFPRDQLGVWSDASWLSNTSGRPTTSSKYNSWLFATKFLSLWKKS